MTTPRIADLAVELGTTATRARRAADIIDTAVAQIFGDPTQPGSGLDLDHPHAAMAVGAVLAGACSSLTAIGCSPAGWAR